MIKKTLNLYFGVPKFTKMFFPVILLQHVLIVFCLNISAYFKKIGYFNYHLIGEFLSIYYGGAFFGAFIGGVLTLRFSTTKISAFGLIFSSINFFCLSGTLNEWLIKLTMFFLGLIGAIIGTSNITSLIRTVKEDHLKLKVISLELILFNLAFSLVSFILLDLTPQKIVQFTRYFPYILFFSGILMLFFYQNSIFDPFLPKNYRPTLFIPKQKQEFFILMIMIFCFGLIFSMVKVVFTPTLIGRFGNNVISALIASVNPWVLFFIQPLIINQIKKTNSTFFLGYGGLIVGVSYWVFGMSNTFSLAVVTLILLTFGEMMFSPLSKQLNILLYGQGKEGIAAGIWKAVFLGSGMIGPRLSGYVAEYYGVNVVWHCCALLGLLCFISSCFLKRIRKSDSGNEIILTN
jgi:predicted MFS family arabinose efflux permease